MVVAVSIVGGIFSKAGSGAVYAMVPLVQRRMTGQIAGMVGAFGNVGAVIFLLLLDKAIERCKANKRSIVSPKDL